MWKRVFSMKRSINPIPLVLAMTIVIASVIIGVYGTRLQEREFGSLMPLGDVADTARQIQFRMQIEALHRPTESPTPTRSDLADLVSSTIKSEWRPPDLSAKGFVPILAGQAILMGDQAGIAILYERAGESADRFWRSSSRVIAGNSHHSMTMEEWSPSRQIARSQSVMTKQIPIRARRSSSPTATSYS